MCMMASVEKIFKEEYSLIGEYVKGDMDYKYLYKECYMIRVFEKTVEKMFEQGKMRGTTHGCIGQEIVSAIVISNINRSFDYITGTHRCHGQILSYTHNPYKLACEMMGKCDGFNYGMGGSQHIKVDKYITNGITGGMASVGAGMALSLKKKKSDAIVVSFLGDGGFQEGYVAETLNLVSVFTVPIVYILENNSYAMSTRTADYSAGSFEKRIKALNIKYFHASSTEIPTLVNTIAEAIKFTRKNRKPAFVDIDTFRLCGHSKSDDMAYMTDEEKNNNLKHDPLIALEKLVNDDVAVKSIQNEVNLLIEKAFNDADFCEQIGILEYKSNISQMR